MAILQEFLRQDQYAPALQAFYAARSKYHMDLNLYVEMIQALSRSEVADHVHRLILDFKGPEPKCTRAVVDIGDVVVIIFVSQVETSSWSPSSS